MKGRHRVVVESPRACYAFEIRRNLTILRGESATGKTTLIDLLSDYAGNGAASPVRMESDVPCRVYRGGLDDWRDGLDLLQDSIIFIDEENRFIKTKEFAACVRGSSNYYETRMNVHY